MYGNVGGNNVSARCHHGGAAFIWPIIQDFQFLDLTPIPIDIKLEGALSQQNIRVNTPSTFMVGISTEPGVMENAAEAQGTLAQLSARAEGFRSIVESAGNAEQAARLMVTEQLPALVSEQVKAISNLKIDSVTVWDSGKGSGTADFVSGLVGVLPPLHELTRKVGIELPEYLGKNAGESAAPAPGGSPSKAPAARQPQKAESRPKLAEWLEANKHLLAAFDLDENQHIDAREVGEAAKMAVQWAAARVNRPDAGWLYAEGDKAQGPVKWSQLPPVPEVLIALEGTDFWLPRRAVEIAA